MTCTKQNVKGKKCKPTFPVTGALAIIVLAVKGESA